MDSNHNSVNVLLFIGESCTTLCDEITYNKNAVKKNELFLVRLYSTK